MSSSSQFSNGNNEGRVLVNVERDQVLKLNRVGTEMWELLAQGLDRGHITDVIAKKYKVSTERVAADLGAFSARLEKLGLRPLELGSKCFLPAQTASHASYPWYGQSLTVLPSPTVVAVLAAVLGLLLVDATLLIFNFKRLCVWVGAWPQRQGEYDDRLIGEVCAAVERACVWYPKQALCLQRSAVTACLLRSFGIRAQMKLGMRSMPFLAHAWVEVDGAVVNDFPGVKTFYSSLASY